MKILVKFEQQPVLAITVNDTETGRIYFDLVRNQHKMQKPYYKDSILWTNEYMIELALKAKQVFGWNWLHDNYDLSITAQLHKDLENSVGKLGFESIPEQYDSLLYDLHHCLHAIQFGPNDLLRPDNFQIEWLTDNSVPLPGSFEFVPNTNYGDLILINPYVGHNPLQIYNENDFSSLLTTCRFHNIVKPGIVLTNVQKYISKETILKKFQEEDPAFVELHGAEKIKYYSGSAVIGCVDDVKIFKHLKNIPAELVLESVEFYD
jgi:hypothetical protein